MIRLACLLVLILVAGSLHGQGLVKGPKTELGDRWIQHAAQDGAPGFRTQITLRRRQVHVHALLDPGAEAGAWGIQCWIADPRVVAARKALLAASRASVKSLEALNGKSEPSDPECREEIRDYLGRARLELDRIRSYDPFYQALLVFGEAENTTDLAEIPFEAELASDGARCAAVDIGFDRHIAIETLHLHSLVYRLALVARTAAKPLPVAENQLKEFRFRTPLDFTPLLREDLRILWPDWGPVGSIYLPVQEGYLPHQVGEVPGPSCQADTDLASAPAMWVPSSYPTELILPGKLAPGWRFWTGGAKLLVRPPGRSRILPVEKVATFSPDADEKWAVVDARGSRRGLHLLLRVDYLSRPGTPSGMCGAGTETELLWLALDREGRLQASDGHLIESCWLTLTLEDQTLQEVPGQPGRSVWVVNGPLENLHPRSEQKRDRKVPWGTQTITYDLAHPERGLVCSKPAPKPLD